MRINLAVNGKRCTWDVNPGEVLLDVLRDKGYVSVKRGCGEGYCGVCTVLVDGKRYNACLLLVGQVHGRSVKTVEALGTTQNPHPIQQAFVDSGAVQCGFCTPGLVLTVKALLDRHPDPSEEQIRAALEVRS